eukprot:SM000074S21654  [mRNA]  locus=s74:151046:154436:+ [translate_table: standard]
MAKCRIQRLASLTIPSLRQLQKRTAPGEGGALLPRPSSAPESGGSSPVRSPVPSVDGDQPEAAAAPPKARAPRANPFGAARPREEVLAEKGLPITDLPPPPAQAAASDAGSVSSRSSSRAQSPERERPQPPARPRVNPFGAAKPREVILEMRQGSNSDTTAMEGSGSMDSSSEAPKNTGLEEDGEEQLPHPSEPEEDLKEVTGGAGATPVEEEAVAPEREEDAATLAEEEAVAHEREEDVGEGTFKELTVEMPAGVSGPMACSMQVPLQADGGFEISYVWPLPAGEEAALIQASPPGTGQKCRQVYGLDYGVAGVLAGWSGEVACMVYAVYGILCKLESS